MEKSHRILIVDDDRQNIKVLTGFLSDDYKIMAVKSGEQALSVAGGDIQPDLILLDIMMKGLDGYEVCGRLKADDRTKEIPVIFVTAVSELMDAARAFEIGAVDYITKPFNLMTVKARIKTHIKLNDTIKALNQALQKVKTLSGLLPICSHCKKIRDDKGYWNQIETYIRKHSDAEFTHSICRECAEKYYPGFKIYDD